MLAEILNNSSVQQLQGILQSRYGRGLKVKFMKDVTSHTSFTSSALTAQSPSRVGGDLRMLITSNGEFLAEATIENGASLSTSDRDAASALVTKVLEPAILNWKRMNENPIEIPPGFESNCESSSDFSNVIPFRKTCWMGTDHKSLLDFDLEPFSLQAKTLFTNVMFLSSKNPCLFPKITSEVHKISQRWASLHFSAIRAQVQSVEDLCDLGSMTIIIDDLLTLSSKEQDLLVDFLEVANLSAHPLLLFTSSTSLRDVELHSFISTRMTPLLKSCYVEVDRLPTSDELLRETLELFLEPEAMI